MPRQTALEGSFCTARKKERIENKPHRKTYVNLASVYFSGWFLFNGSRIFPCVFSHRSCTPDSLVNPNTDELIHTSDCSEKMRDEGEREKMLSWSEWQTSGKHINGYRQIEKGANRKAIRIDNPMLTPLPIRHYSPNTVNCMYLSVEQATPCSPHRSHPHTHTQMGPRHLFHFDIHICQCNIFVRWLLAIWLSCVQCENCKWNFTFNCGWWRCEHSFEIAISSSYRSSLALYIFWYGVCNV